MNERDAFEERLRTHWRPRPPSGGVAVRLFGQGQETKEGAPVWRWLVPAMTAALTSFVILATLHPQPRIGISGSTDFLRGFTGASRIVGRESNAVWRWQSSATGAVLVSLLTLGVLETDLPESGSALSEAVGGMARTSLERVGTLVCAAQTPRHNSVAAQRIEWTSASAFPSSMPSPFGLGTNYSRR